MNFTSFKSEGIWSYFEREDCGGKPGQHAQCKTCKKVMKCVGGSTSGLHNHQKSVHNVVTLKRPVAPEKSDTYEKVKITNFFQPKTTLNETLSRMTALDGIPFRVFVTSKDLRRALLCLYKDLPTSVNGIKSRVYEYAAELKQVIKTQLESDLRSGKRFSLTFDEWTSMKNVRYLNINVHSNAPSKLVYNLGLLRITGKFSSERCESALRDKLHEFKLNLDTDIVCVTTDGCNMMIKLGKMLSCPQQLCYNHGIHLAVLDVLYQKKFLEDSDICEIATSDIDSDSESEHDDSDHLLLVEEPCMAELLSFNDESIKETIDKIRFVVKAFRKSPKNNETLLRYMKESDLQFTSLILDCKTRWSSLADMLERVIISRQCIQKAQIDIQIREEKKLTDQDFKTIQQISNVLKPVRLAVTSLSRRDANLLTAEGILKFVFNELDATGTEMGKEMKKAIDQRIVQDRYTKESVILQYLHNPQAKLQKKSVVKTYCCEFLRRMKCEEKGVQTSDDDLKSYEKEHSTTKETNQIMEETLERAIADSLRKNPSESDNDFNSVIASEIASAEQSGKLGFYLQKVYDHLITIPPTSVEAERAFSTAGYFCSKIRNRLSDKSLDVLCFIRSNMNFRERLNE